MHTEALCFYDAVIRAIDRIGSRPYDYHRTHETLLSMASETVDLDAVENNSDPERWILVYAGPNASGKSTVAAALNQELNLPFINPDMYAKLLYGDVPDEESRYRDYAMPYAEKLRERFMESGLSFSFETVFSDTRKLGELDRYKSRGYRIAAVLVGTGSPEINKERALIRESEGGHHVPPDKIESRYYKSLSNFQELLWLSDEAVVIDNSGAKPVGYIRKIGGNCSPIDGHAYPSWFRKHIPNPVERGV